MKRLFGSIRPSVLAIAAVAVLSLVGSAAANRAIRDNSINTRDIKNNQVNTRDLRNNTITTRDIRDNQVNTRDLRDSAIRGVDVHDGALEAVDMSSSVTSLLGAATLVDPRAHDTGACCLSWAQGPTAVTEVGNGGDPLPKADSGRAWRSIVLEPGDYVVQQTLVAQPSAKGARAGATRLFLGGAPLRALGGYAFATVEPDGLPVPHSTATAIEVGNGSADQRRLSQRAISIGAAANLSDELLIWKVVPR